MPRFIDQEKVTRYVQVCAEIKKLTDKKTKLHDELVKAFKEGFLCPRNGPYLIAMTYQNRAQISWKDEFIKLAKNMLGKSWLKYRRRIENEAPLVKTPMLLPKPNPDYEVESDKVTSIRRG